MKNEDKKKVNSLFEEYHNFIIDNMIDFKGKYHLTKDQLYLLNYKFEIEMKNRYYKHKEENKINNKVYITNGLVVK